MPGLLLLSRRTGTGQRKSLAAKAFFKPDDAILDLHGVKAELGEQDHSRHGQHKHPDCPKTWTTPDMEDGHRQVGDQNRKEQTMINKIDTTVVVPILLNRLPYSSRDRISTRPETLREPLP